MIFNKKMLFSEINPFCYALSRQKEIMKRFIKDLLSKKSFSKEKQSEKLPHLVSEYSSEIIKKGKGIDINLQTNKGINIEIASGKINGIIVRPGEVFSFWKTVGRITKKKGYKDGRIILRSSIKPGIGGGLCNLANTINLLILHSPLEIIEIHKHSDALSPDGEKRVPFGAGTSVSYNYVDYRFKNTTDQNVQLLVWCEDGKLYGELRSEYEFPYSYELIEEDHHFKKEGNDYYRMSKIYRQVTDKSTGSIIDKELIWNNRSLVMYDSDLIPKDMLQV